MRLPLFLTALSLALPLEHTCSRPPPRPHAEARCARPVGRYDAIYALRRTEGSCSRAKPESHDPMQFDEQGRYLSPAEGIITCQTAQSGCRLQIRCSSEVLEGAEADLDAQLSADAGELTGVGTVTGYYQGCREVVYDVHARHTGP